MPHDVDVKGSRSATPWGSTQRTSHPHTMAAYIVACARTATGRQNGALRNAHPATLGAAVLDACINKFPSLDPAQVDDVIMGCVSQVSEQAGNLGRAPSAFDSAASAVVRRGD